MFVMLLLASRRDLTVARKWSCSTIGYKRKNIATGYHHFPCEASDNRRCPVQLPINSYPVPSNRKSALRARFRPDSSQDNFIIRLRFWPRAPGPEALLRNSRYLKGRLRQCGSGVPEPTQVGPGRFFVPSNALKNSTRRSPIFFSAVLGPFWVPNPLFQDQTGPI